MAAAGEIARQLRSFRESAISDMEAMRDPTMSVETWSQPLEKLIADGLLNPAPAKMLSETDWWGQKNGRRSCRSI